MVAVEVATAAPLVGRPGVLSVPISMRGLFAGVAGALVGLGSPPVLSVPVTAVTAEGTQPRPAPAFSVPISTPTPPVLIGGVEHRGLAVILVAIRVPLHRHRPRLGGVANRTMPAPIVAVGIATPTPSGANEYHPAYAVMVGITIVEPDVT